MYLFISKNSEKQAKLRVFRHPIINSGYVDLVLCSEEGSIINKRISKKNKEDFKIAKKAKCGDKIA